MASSLGGIGDQTSFSGSNLNAAPSFSKSVTTSPKLLSNQQNLGATSSADNSRMPDDQSIASFTMTMPTVQEVQSASFMSGSHSPLL